MNYAIVYCSKTGNTKRLATAIQETLGETCCYCGEPSEEAYAAELVFVGFWTDKGSCQEEIKAFLKGLDKQRVFLFGTAGFGGEQSYFDRILSGVKQEIPQSCTCVGSFMCQGAMPMSVRERYVSMLAQNEKMQAMIDNFDHALSHPTQEDIAQLLQLVQNV